jgi:hypothetical protein
LLPRPNPVKGNSVTWRFSLVELPEDGLDRLLTTLNDTRVAGKQLKLRRYRED